MSEILLAPPPLCTADLPGIGGRIKALPEDFEVEEIPAYEPSGSGDFLYLWVEKRDLGVEYFTRQVAKRLNLSPGEIGTAGLKDRRAVTRQWVSVPASAEPNLADLNGDGIRVLKVSRHTNKLRAGHLHGNRFRVLVRDLAGEGATMVTAVVDRLRQHGLPNFYGAQRFGKDGETLRLGLALLHGETRERQVRNPFLKKLALSAVQSALFNHYLGQRLTDGLLRRVLLGDVLAKYPFGGMFVAEDLAGEQPRFDAREVVSAGPIVGRKTFPAKDEAAQREAASLAAFQMTPALFAGFGKLLQGTRRHNLVYLDDLTWEAVQESEVGSQKSEVGSQKSEVGTGIRLEFSLPAGSYATVLLREIMKNDLDAIGEATVES